MIFTVATSTQVISLEVDPEMSMADIKLIVQCEVGLNDVNDCSLFYNGKELISGTLKENNITGDVTVSMIDKSAPQPTQSQPTTADPLEDYRRLIERVKSNPYELSMLHQQDPALGEAIDKNDVEKVKEILDGRLAEKKKVEEEKMRLMRLAEENPFDLEVQRKIEEQINQENISHNLNLAMEHNPEAFSQVHMLYIHCEINGVPIKAFVDSGAQMSILDSQCAAKCEILRLVDKRFHGMAQGVGSKVIIGKIHACGVKLGNSHLTFSFSVLEDNSVDFIIGLDLLKRHQCCIDLKHNCLRIGTTGEQIPFLSENELPDKAKPQTQQQQESMGASSAPAATSEDHEESIKNLMALGGFSREEVLATLKIYKGDIQAAAAHLIG